MTTQKIRIALIALCAVVSSVAPVSAAPRSGGIPHFKGEWHPAVGAGAVYQLEQKGQPPMTWEVAVVGKEGDGYWIENRTTVPQEAIAKMLLTKAGPQRFIVKAAGQPAMELPAMQAQGMPETDLKNKAKLIGKEQVTTPAGTFACEHYQVQDRSGTADVWVASSVSPYGLVKMTSKDATVTLSKLVKGAKARITETPQKIEMPQMPSLADLMGKREE